MIHAAFFIYKNVNSHTFLLVRRPSMIAYLLREINIALYLRCCMVSDFFIAKKLRYT